MYYVTNEQLTAILMALKNLHVKAETFDDADAWVGLYVAIQNIQTQTIPEKKEESAVEPKGE